MTHDDIRAQFTRLGLSEGDGMILLADSLTISDLCVTVEDIWQGDIEPAVKWLKSHRPPAMEENSEPPP